MATDETSNQHIHELRSQSIKELIDTEIQYVNDLLILSEVYMKSLSPSNSTIINAEQHRLLFNHIPTLIKLHQQFKHSLEQRYKHWDSVTQQYKHCDLSSSKIADQFLQFAPYFHMYQQYLNGHDQAVTLISKLYIQSSKFKTFMDNIQSKGYLDLKAYLVKPLQRITKYSLLLRELSKYTHSDHPDYNDLQLAMEKINQVSLNIKDNMKTFHQRQKVRDIQSRFTQNINIVSPARYFIKEGKLMKICRKKDVMYIFLLFSDLLVYGEQANDEGQIKVHQQIPIDPSFSIVDIPWSDKYKGKCWEIHSPQKSFVVYADHPGEKQEWLNEMEKVVELRCTIESGRQRTAPLWIPDNFTKQCMMHDCGKTFTRTNRRHHCRYCGRLVCGKCSKHKLADWNKKKKSVRVCDTCYIYYGNDREEEEIPYPRKQRSKTWHISKLKQVNSVDSWGSLDRQTMPVDDMIIIENTYTSLSSPEDIYIDEKEVVEEEKVLTEQELESKCSCEEVLVPLHLFESKDICNRIKAWKCNDIQYKKDLLKMSNILSKRQYNGEKIVDLRNNGLYDDMKKALQSEFMSFMEIETIDIVFNCFDEWITNEQHDVKSKSAEEIAHILYEFPLNKLLDKIMQDNINGMECIEWIGNGQDFIHDETGWDIDEIYQIHAILCMKKTFTKDEFINNMQNMMNNKPILPDAITDEIKRKIVEFDVEHLHFKIKNGMDILEFSDAMINLVDDLMERNEKDRLYAMDDLVPRIYALVSDCFILKPTDRNKIWRVQIPLNKQTAWICYNCTNYNFHQFIDGMMQCDLSICSLCGIHQREAIILKLKNSDTFSMINDVNVDNKYDDDGPGTHDDIDSLIQTAIDHPSFDLKCPNRHDNTHCPSLLRLAKHLIIYKRWLHTVYKNTNGNDNIEQTIQIDIVKYIDDEEYQNILIESARNNGKITENDAEIIVKMLENNIENTGNCETLVNLTRNGFVKLFRRHTKIKGAILRYLHRITLRVLKKAARMRQFGEFLSEIAICNIDKDYYHIIKSHIQNGTKETIKNAFRFFQTVVHYEDLPSDIDECRSCKRKQDRIKSSNSNVDPQGNKGDKDMWTLQQYYAQSQLDVIHSYLVHSNWKHFVQRLSNKNKDDDDDDNEMATDDIILTESDVEMNKDKFVSDSYGFGVDHSYPHLKDKWRSIRDELVFNTLYPITVKLFHNLLIKAVKTHQIAVCAEYIKDELICKYFNSEYNIIRNDPIHISHILALITYTDITTFCTVFRATYRRIDDETEDEEVTKRHQQLYHYSRCLFEAVEFYGEYMTPKLKVYHGLNKVLYFGNFTAYFYQPISTTTSLSIAQQFSEGQGIILCLKVGTAYLDSSTPKYLNASWLSNFPQEEELLFYGSHEVFQINNIIESETLKGHSNELLMFNKFQQTIQNHKIEWKKMKMIESLVTLIEYEQNYEEEKDEEYEELESNDKYITKYGRELFHYFCSNENNTKIVIKNFKSLPMEIYNVLFTQQQISMISFIPICNLFKSLKEIILNGLNNSQFTRESRDYVEAVIKCIENASDLKLEKITLQSEQQFDHKINTTLKNVATKMMNRFKRLQWKIEYDFRSLEIHSLVFTKS